MWTRNGNEISTRFRELLEIPRVVGVDVVLDCELCVFDESGYPVFERIPSKAATHTLVAFDVLECDGASIVDKPIEEQRAILERVIPTDVPILYRSRAFTNAQALYDECIARGLEGVVVKRAGSRYLPGRRSPVWQKMVTPVGAARVRSRMRHLRFQ